IIVPITIHEDLHNVIENNISNLNAADIGPIDFKEISICELERAEQKSDSQVSVPSMKKRRSLETVKVQTAESPPRRCAKDTDEIDLEKVLKFSKSTIAAWNSYKLNGKLRDTDRDAIAGAVIDYELTDDLDRRISPGRFVFLSEQILKYFPTEAQQSVWAVINSTSVFLTGKGKLYTRWSNTRRKYMELGLIPRQTKGRKGTGRPNANDKKVDDIEIQKF
ncbi:uncharacterized protein LOC112494159, partial [Cephus cinctus]|uniref:Uncharacterized protein LOC112494159 n=1 Tax=Cephus cinctus TaxID=211228 RepID=A0AAJ7REK5_CEPCN